jgi:hypothetical protein
MKFATEVEYVKIGKLVILRFKKDKINLNIQYDPPFGQLMRSEKRVKLTFFT